MRRLALFAACLAVVSGSPVRAQAPPFGTELQRWSLQMSGAYAGSGMTWCRDEGKFYLMDQGYAGACRVWCLDPADPEGSIAPVPWTFVNLGGPTSDIPWSIVWDPDSTCFWMSQILDGSIYSACYLLRFIGDSTGWVWRGTPADSWRFPSYYHWISGIEKHPTEGVFYATYGTSPDTSGLGRLDPYTKTILGYLSNGIGISERGLTLVPYDSNYILTCGWNADKFRKRDSTGLLLQQADGHLGPSDWALYVPQVIYPDDTVCAYCICSHSANYFQRISTGMVWWQLGSVGLAERHHEKTAAPTASVICRGFLFLPGNQPAGLLNIAGRRVRELRPGPNNIRHVAPGIYFITPSPQPFSSGGEGVRKVVVQR